VVGRWIAWSALLDCTLLAELTARKQAGQEAFSAVRGEGAAPGTTRPASW